ncbi:MAG: hypothetical protein NTW29_18840 [Bacteroidetes bacterium]|nr:hypothetical protein [Bacteroidota bacterium]
MNDTTLTTSESLSKKDLQRLVFEKLAGALGEYKENLKEKKFTRNLKKASKLFAADIARTIGKKSKIKQAKKADKHAIAKTETAEE